MIDGQEVLTQQSSVKLGKRGLPQWDEQSVTEEEGHTRKHENLYGGELKNEQPGCETTPARHNDSIKLELPRAWEPLDSLRPLQTCEGTSS